MRFSGLIIVVTMSFNFDHTKLLFNFKFVSLRRQNI